MDQRLKGQEVSIRAVANGQVLSTIDSVSSMNEAVALEIKEQGYLGEPVNRFDEILNGYGGDFDMHVTNANWIDLELQIIARATREQPGLTFNVVRTDIFPNGDTIIYTYIDVSWGAMPQNVGSRGDYVKVHAEFKCSERTVKRNSLP
jgi:hypothetical protein